MRTNQQQSSRRRTGTAIVEFALAASILIMVLMGIMEFGWLMKYQNQLANAVREGARKAAFGSYVDTAEDRIRVVAAPLVFPVGEGQIRLEYSTDGGATWITLANDAQLSGNTAPTGSIIRVWAQAKYPALTGFFPYLNSYKLSSTVNVYRERHY